MPPLVTIGLPVFNSERYIRNSLDSLLGQTYSDFVLVISDNASEDATPSICDEYVRRDRRVRYYRNATNIGNPGNFNRVFRLAETPYLKWSTADDWWEPTFLEKAVDILERNPDVVLCYPQADTVDMERGERSVYHDVLHLVQEDPVERFIALLDRIGLAHQHLGLIRTDVLRRTHLLGPFVGSDINLLAELSLYGKFYELPELLFHRRFHKTSGSWKRGDTKHEAAYYLASGAKPRQLKHVKSHLAFVRAVLTAPLTPGARMRALGYLARRGYWERSLLLSDLRGLARRFMSSDPGSVGPLDGRL